MSSFLTLCCYEIAPFQIQFKIFLWSFSFGNGWMIEVELNRMKICTVESWNMDETKRLTHHNFYYFTDMDIFTDWVLVWIFSLLLTGTCEMIADWQLLRSVSTKLRSETLIVRWTDGQSYASSMRCGQTQRSCGANLTCCGLKISTKMVSIFFYWWSYDISLTMHEAMKCFIDPFSLA